ncbi:uncharacterized protein LOC141855498 [Brevipalpus obovatus]|uniref:uncharacterized protein LOC141855498 n=1 Tax=Brevipalpus obovatus TaxID=246614 RepID=UPI003D9F2BF7
MHSCGDGENSSPGRNDEGIQFDQFCENRETPRENGNLESSDIDTCTVQNLSIKSSDERDKSETRGRKMTVINFLPTDCKLCGQNFTSDKALGYHIRDVHVVGKKDEKKDEEKKKKASDYRYVRGKDWKVLNPKRPFCCSTCNKRFLYESSLNHHRVVKHGEKIITPDGSISTIPPKMYDHTFQCEKCGKVLMSKHSLVRHLVSFHGTDHEKPFQCDICGQRYVSISSLVSHRRKEHTGDKPFKCEHCGKDFTMSNRLKCHLRVHSDEKFYKCTQCSKQFKSCSAFRAHKDTHAGVMRHMCKYCGRRFLFQGNMIKHIRRRHPNGGEISNYSINLPENSKEMRENSIEINLKKDDKINNSVPEQLVLNHGKAIILDYQKASYLNHGVSEMNPTNGHPDPPNQMQNMNNFTPLDQFVKPEIQFQILPLTSMPSQELFNGIVYQAQSNPSISLTAPIKSHSNVVTSSVTLISNQRGLQSTPNYAIRCRLCDQTFSDIRLHITNFHRIPPHKVNSLIPSMIHL